MSARRQRPASKEWVRWGVTVTVLFGLVMGSFGSVMAAPPLSHGREARPALTPHPALLAREPTQHLLAEVAVAPTHLRADGGAHLHPLARVSPSALGPKDSSTAGGPAFSASVAADLATYTVVFNETGLTAAWKTKWCVTFNGTQSCSTKSSIDFAGFVNGTYNYSIGHLTNYTLSTPYNGSVTVAGGTPGTVSNTVTVHWSLVKYVESFVENGLPKNTNWSVTMGGKTKSTTSKKITFPFSNGTYPFGVGTVKGYRATPPNGNVTVNGGNATQAIAFASTAGGGSLTVYYVVAGGIVVVAIAVIIGLVLRRRRRAAKAEPPTPSPPTEPPETPS